MGMKPFLVMMAVFVLAGCESVFGPANAKGVTRNGVEVWVCPNCDEILGRQYDRFGSQVYTHNHRRGDGYYCRQLEPINPGNPFPQFRRSN